MPSIAVLNDQATGNNSGGYICQCDPRVLADNIPVAKINDDVLVWGLTNIPPTGVREVTNFPTQFTPTGTPIQWFIMEYGTILSGSSVAIDSQGLSVAIQGSSWQSSHFSGQIQATSRHQA